MAKWISHTYTFGCVCAQLLSHVWFFATPWTVASRFPLSWGFSRQEYWSGLPFPLPTYTYIPSLPDFLPIQVTTVHQVEFSVLYSVFPTVVYFITAILFYSFPGAQAVKNLPAVHETWVWYLDQKDPLEKGMATHSSILAWRIQWTEELGRPQFTGSQGVGHNWATISFTFSSIIVCMCQSQSPNSSHPPPLSPLVSIYLFSMSPFLLCK